MEKTNTQKEKENKYMVGNNLDLLLQKEKGRIKGGQTRRAPPNKQPKEDKPHQTRRKGHLTPQRERVHQPITGNQPQTN